MAETGVKVTNEMLYNVLAKAFASDDAETIKKIISMSVDIVHKDGIAELTVKMKTNAPDEDQPMSLKTGDTISLRY